MVPITYLDEDTHTKCKIVKCTANFLKHQLQDEGSSLANFETWLPISTIT